MTNKTQASAKSKDSEVSLEEYMERLGRISGERKVAGILRWMGVSSSSYSNWMRRGTIPYKTLVNILLERGISLNWFFAPYKKLEVPLLRDPSIREGAQTYLQQRQANEKESERVLKAYSECQALLLSHGAQVSERHMRLMLDIYFKIGERVVHKEQVLDHLAQSLSEMEAQT
ncbi:MAG: helix-turn-helix domain-containing protein [Idiomarina sp.]|nr:helix-turn-helix domain-containing protein [Idiomarina sp.]